MVCCAVQVDRVQAISHLFTKPDVQQDDTIMCCLCRCQQKCTLWMQAMICSHLWQWAVLGWPALRLGLIIHHVKPDHLRAAAAAGDGSSQKQQHKAAGRQQKPGDSSRHS